MLIKNSILVKLCSIRCSDMELYLNATKDIKVSKITCPCCKAPGQCEYISPYKRMMISAADDTPKVQCLSIKRVKCNSCGHTHAILPDILIPYGSYSIRFILIVLTKYLQRMTSVAVFCDKWHIAVSTLYSWIHLFIDHYSSFVSALDRISSISEKEIASVVDHDTFINAFFERFRFHFLQCKTTSYSPPHSPSGSFPGGRT